MTPKEKNRRLTISIPEGHYKAVERLAARRRVSLSWVVREAIRELVENDSPLLNEITEIQAKNVRH
jgi:metal-responsive CopG/Arc/MetJ family transcriptional regulator